METDLELLARLRHGEESAFVSLVARYNPSLLRVARAYVPNHALAEEVVQETWIGVLRGIEGFEGRSSIKTWIFKILINRARTIGLHEPRHLGLSGDQPAVDPLRFDSGGAWAKPLESWESEADDRMVAASWSQCLGEALDDLPARQREVVVLRDVEGLEGGEVCELLGLTEANQRVLLHRGRSRLRSALEAELDVRGR
ncbi:MAG TPA: sigma-70 family RNA polymerase sigma factor [Acidimicrobiales bacterium]